jgi:hypothetical protein
MKSKTLLFELLVDGVPYEVRATPFEFNTSTRFRVSSNGGPAFIFAWDEEMKRLTAIGDGTSTIPDNLERAIAEKLESMAATRP